MVDRRPFRRGVGPGGNPGNAGGCGQYLAGGGGALHDESGMAGDTHSRAKWSTTSVLPSSHRGQGGNERPVSAS